MGACFLMLNGVPVGGDMLIRFNLLEISLIVLAIGVLIGLINGVLVARLKVAPFIATLATLYVVRGAALLSSDGRTFPDLVGAAYYGTAGFPLIGGGYPLGFPVPVWLLGNRQSVFSGKSGLVRLVLGGAGIIKKKK